MNSVILETLRIIPKLLNFEFDVAEDVNEFLLAAKKVIDYDFGLVCYFNALRLNVKGYKDFVGLGIFEIDKVYIDVEEEVFNLLYRKETFCFDSNNRIAQKIFKNLRSDIKFVYTPLFIKGTMFGFAILCKKGRVFNEEEIEIVSTLFATLSYAIKDTELSNVMKLQLKALQEAILEKSQANKIIKEQNQKLIESNRAQNEFFANISHELRTPLNAIIGFSEALETNLFGPLNEKQQDYVKDIHISGIHLLGMINEILDISKLESKTMQLLCKEFSLEVAIKEVLNVIRPLAKKKNIEVESDIDFSIVIEADYQKLQQILYNILSNAIKFTLNRGKIKIKSMEKEGDVIISITDTGIGIDKKYHGKIFGKFVQLNSTYTKTESSTGLGLTITKELVEMHNGRIFLESKVGEGTTFFVQLPKKQERK